MALAEPDQAIYLQYARNMATGNPYIYSPGDSPSSGSTTHLYIFLLSLIYRLGATGTFFHTATFILNAVFYLSIITCIWLIIKKMAPEVLPLTMGLTVLSGHIASAVLRQTDIGLLMLLTLGLFASLLYRQQVISAILIMACAATRPEGMIFSIAFIMIGVGEILFRNFHLKQKGFSLNAKRYFLFGMIGFLIFGTTLFINFKTTGYFQFMSVANKGYFNRYPVDGALILTLTDFLSLLKGFFGGLQESFRQFYLLPVISGVLGLSGILLYAREKKMVVYECWLGLSVLGSLLLIASSQFQGISNDRYLGWIMPFWIIYISIGWNEISERLHTPYLKLLSACILILYQPLSLAYVASDTYRNAVYIQQELDFIRTINNEFPSTANFCFTRGAGLNYFVPKHKIFNPYGITSPDFFDANIKDTLKLIDLLKHKPELRFEYWITSKAFLSSNSWILPFIGELVLQDTDTALTTDQALGIYKAKWETIENGLKPRIALNSMNNLQLIDQLDVGYGPHESAHHYRLISRLKNTSFPLVAKTDDLNGQVYSENGRTIYGAESFTIQNVNPDKPITMILRTGRSASGTVLFGASALQNRKTELNTELMLHLFVNGKKILCPPVQLQEKGFSEIAFHIPANYLKKETAEIYLSGDHISYGFWFYQ
ncbi:hypothetical protein EGM51_17890 [Verrucomicrobia bacterium S94]|nr:hypothetical protein EGM51_17890 [Verrucomicrobia bacterium S94]